MRFYELIRALIPSMYEHAADIWIWMCDADLDDLFAYETTKKVKVREVGWVVEPCRTVGPLEPSRHSASILPLPPGQLFS